MTDLDQDFVGVPVAQIRDDAGYAVVNIMRGMDSELAV
jgi:hypothetical protein